MIAAAFVMFVLHVATGGSCVNYAVQANTGTGWQPKTAWSVPGGAQKLPRIGESGADTFYVSLTQSGLATSVRCACVAARGDTGRWSNAAAAVPAGSWARDTTLYGWRGENWVQIRIAGPLRQAAFVSPDTAAVYVETLDAEQLRLKARHCRACGYWWLRGVKQACVSQPVGGAR